VIHLEEQRDRYAGNDAEQRDHSRYPVDEDAVLLFAGLGKLQPGRIVNLSQEGCRVRSKERLAVRSHWPLEVSFKLNGVAFRLSGVLQWTDGGTLLGIRFVNVNPRRMVELANVICGMQAGVRARGVTMSRLVLEREVTKRAEQAVGSKTERRLDAGPREAAGEHQAPKPAASEATAEVDPPAARPAEGRDRRENVRHDVDTSASILLVNIGSTLQGRILDLSLGGCRIRTSVRFPVGIYTRVETEFRLEGLPFRLGGVIQAIHDRNTVGIRFLDLSQRKRQQVHDLITEIEELRAAQIPPEAVLAERRE
jgi:hypothetical protein